MRSNPFLYREPHEQVEAKIIMRPWWSCPYEQTAEDQFYVSTVIENSYCLTEEHLNNFCQATC